MLTCPHCQHKLTDAEVRSLWASRNGKKQTPHAGPGRPPMEDRCPCGAMTRERAKKRGHVCTWWALDAP